MGIRGWGEQLLSRFSGVRLWAVITLRHNGRDKSVKVGYEINIVPYLRDAQFHAGIRRKVSWIEDSAPVE